MGGGAKTGGNYKTLSEYMNAHNYSAKDYPIYSQDKTWQDLVEAEFPTKTSSNNNKEIEGIRTWIGEINPMFKNPFNSKARHNCGSCAYAVESRLNGDNTAVASLDNIGTDAGMEQITNKKCEYKSFDEITQIIKDAGAGAHFIIGINRKYLIFNTAGHWFNAFYDGEKIYTIDGQTGEVMEWPYDYGHISEWCIMI